MANGIVDIYISKELADHTMVLIYNCEGGLANDLHLIGDGHYPSLLQRATLEGNVRVTHEQGSDCAFKLYGRLRPATARKYRLRNGSRFMLEYAPNENKLRMRRITTSQAQWTASCRSTEKPRPNDHHRLYFTKLARHSRSA